MEDKKLEELNDEAVDGVAGGLYFGRKPNEPAIGERPRELQPRGISGETMGVAEPDGVGKTEKKIFPITDHLI